MLKQLEEIRGTRCAFHSEACCSYLVDVNVNMTEDVTTSLGTWIHQPVEASMCSWAAMSVGETPAP
jgi:hypothetical protein